MLLKFNSWDTKISLIYKPEVVRMVRVFHRMRGVSQQVVHNLPEFGAKPISVTCFYCHNVVTTKIIESRNTVCCIMYVFIYTIQSKCIYFCAITMNHWMRRFLCLTMCCPGCKNVEHRCPQCNVILGNFKPA